MSQEPQSSLEPGPPNISVPGAAGHGGSAGEREPGAGPGQPYIKPGASDASGLGQVAPHLASVFSPVCVHDSTTSLQGCSWGLEVEKALRKLSLYVGR